MTERIATATRNREFISEHNPFTMPVEWEAPRGTEVDRMASIEFRGFNEKQEAWMRGALDVLGLPLKNVTRVQFQENGDENKNWLGSMNYNDGTITLYGRVGHKDVPDIQAFSTSSHEQIHSNSALNPENDELYGGRENRLRISQHIYDLTEQSAVTGIPLNGYHEVLIDQARTGEISYGRLHRETEAIMEQMALNHREDLLNVQNRQYRKLMKMKAEGDEMVQDMDFTYIAGQFSNGELVGADYALNAQFQYVNPGCDYAERLYEIHCWNADNPNPFKEKKASQTFSFSEYYTPIVNVN